VFENDSVEVSAERGESGVELNFGHVIGVRTVSE
jgi:hypothetical protein